MTDLRGPLTALLVFAAVGCEDSGVANVTGRVTFGGKPVTEGRVVFYPERSRPAAGDIGPDGRYTLTTFGSADGALVGKHKVTVESRRTVTIGHAPASPDEEAARGFNGVEYRIEWIVPAKYAEPGTSPLTAEVKREANEIDFDLPAVDK